MVLFERVAQRQFAMEFITVSSSVAAALEISSISEVGDDSLRSTFSDADCVGDVTQSYARILGNAQQHVCVVSEKCPVRHMNRIQDAISFAHL